MSNDKCVVVWLRRDLRLEDNIAIEMAKRTGHRVLLLFIFDENILEELPDNDPRVNFIYDSLEKMNLELKGNNGGVLVKSGNPYMVWQNVASEYQIESAYWNHDYEPYALQRDENVRAWLATEGISNRSFKDQVIFEKDEIVKDNGLPYTVFTPYMKKWKSKFDPHKIKPSASAEFTNWYKPREGFPMKNELGIAETNLVVKNFSLEELENYSQNRNLPALSNSRLSPHLRFGTISIRELILKVKDRSDQFLNELIWREFFMQILFHFPKTVEDNFKPKYNNIPWRNNEEEFLLWCQGKTGYPLVDAGMRELNETGYMHGRVRMVVASFLCKHLLIDWRWGEMYFASKLLDFELAANVGNWQWVAGTGCDAAPYFRIFNPTEQLKKFDPEMEYVRKWVKDIDELTYPQPMVDHKFARQRCLDAYKEGIAAYELETTGVK